MISLLVPWSQVLHFATAVRGRSSQSTWTRVWRHQLQQARTSAGMSEIFILKDGMWIMI